MIEKIAVNIANSIRKNNPNSNSFAVLRFALIAVMNYVLIILLLGIVAAFTGRLIDTAITLLSFPFLRYFSGGIHLKSTSVCVLISTVIVCICVYVPCTYWNYGFTLNIVSVVLLALFAPSGIRQSKMPKSQYPILKLIAVLIVGSNFLIHSSVLSIAFFAQSVTTIPIFDKWIDKLKW